LIELMVVIAIIAILAGLLMPAIGAALNKSHEARVQNMIHQCEIAATSFFNDHGDYPPSTWAGMFQMLKYDADGDGTVGDYTNPADPDYIVVNFPGFPLPGGDPRTNNQGIEVFLACVATSNGGPYMQPSDWQLKNTDADTDNANSDIAKATNWYFRAPAPQPLLELADWWGNPLIYIHNRNYAETDGVTGMTSLQYLGANQETIQVWSRYSNGFQTGTPPKLDSYQLFSLGSNGVENLTPVGATYVTPAQWTLKQMHFLANWEE
jgi:type II secretory pathway pseudopilin PulG